VIVSLSWDPTAVAVKGSSVLGSAYSSYALEMINQCREQHKIELTMGSASRSLCGLAQPVAFMFI